jgi:hypothetical protein
VRGSDDTPEPRRPHLGSTAHELNANLNFSERGLSDTMAAYWALCKLIREHEGGTEIERSQESMIVRSLQRMTNSGVGLTDQLIADGGHARYDQIAEKAEVSESTVYRWLARMGDAVESDNGVITFHSIQLREQFQEIIGRTVTSVQNAVDQAVKAADDVLERDAYQRNPAGPIDSWKAKWGAEFSEDADVLRLGTTLSPPDHDINSVYDAGDVVLNGLDAWRKEGRPNGNFAQVVEFRDTSGHQHTVFRDQLVEKAKKDHVDNAIQQLATSINERADDVVDVIDRVQTMIHAGPSWTAEEIQAAVEEAGYDIDVEQHARPDFHIPETPE